MKHDRFKAEMRRQAIRRGTFVICYTANSICAGYVEGICYPTKRRGFINLAGTRKINQGRKEDWYDHVYSVRLSRIKRMVSIGDFAELEGKVFYAHAKSIPVSDR
jgi:hypothetical protein